MFFKFFHLFAANFANPKEKLTPEQCKERVRGTAQAMRVLTLKIKNPVLCGAINITILELEYAAYKCCEKSHWTECLNPIINAWNDLKKSIDETAAFAPRVITPPR